MDAATQTMIANLEKNTGKNLEEWIEMVQKQHFAKHKEIIDWLKNSHGLTYGFANLIAHKSKGSDAESANDQDELIKKQYQGKEHLKPIYDYLLAKIQAFGSDVEVAPKISYVSLRRKKQFALLNPATKTRFEIGLNLKGEDATERLLAEKPNAMCSHKIQINDLAQIDDEVLNWLQWAYQNAG
ncbi:DUF5655 domain-containing protein [Algoriphagus hitonicola]|uniref:Predicted transport protein n=1 Tax=Algoriphagus hitonicola TaxID=435880 RepID=A0A1I2TF62_9BACT|nr:DUF4287 domain-containing protein [Algoriphagus hitonicola]SFG60941.1 Predicted transport protein [Algoriphagus hitonicola]